MGKTMALVAGLVAFCAVSADAAGPDVRGIREGECIRLPFQLKGKLIQKQVFVGFREGPPETDGRGRIGLPMPRPIFSYEWALQAADGKTTFLVLGESQAMLKKAAALRDTNAIATGRMSGGKLHVSFLEAETITLSGTLKQEVMFLELGRLCPPGSREISLPIRIVTRWSLDAGGKNYTVAFANAELQKTALALVGKDVKATGKIEGGVFTVSALVLDVRRCCPLVPKVTVRP